MTRISIRARTACVQAAAITKPESTPTTPAHRRCVVIQLRMLNTETMWPALAVVLFVICFLTFRGLHDRSKRRPAIEDPEEGEVEILWPDELEDRENNVEQVKLLFEYTKFHITVYTTLASVLAAIIAAAGAQRFSIDYSLLPAAVLAILAAGWAAGVVAATMPQSTRLQNFWNWRTGPYSTHLMTIRGWTYLEHTSFWLAVVIVVVAFLRGGSTQSEPSLIITISGALDKP
jgi:hypothetical protein